MKIVFENQNEKRIISVFTNCNSIKEREYFYSLFVSKQLIYSIDFYDIKVLNIDIIQFLMTLRAENYWCDICVHSSYLYQYFRKCGLHSQLIKSQNSYKEKSIHAIGIGGSADSLDKIIRFIEHFEGSTVAIFIVQHVKEDTPNLLPEILKGRTNLGIVMPLMDTVIIPGMIYIAPNGYHMRVKDGKVCVSKDAPIGYARPSIDALFISLAEMYNDHLLVIYLCGFGTDGLKAVEVLIKNHAQIIVEDPSECGADYLPRSIIKSGVQSVLSLDDIVMLLNRKTTNVFNEQYIKDVLEYIYEEYGFDFRNYQEESIKRRLNGLMNKFQLTTADALESQLKTDKEKVEDLIGAFSINTTEMFRDSEFFLVLKNKILPYLNSYPNIKIWCAGCSTGEEPYSLVILLNELGMLHKTQIYATDMNADIIDEAKNGIFSLDNFKKYHMNYLNAGGANTFDHYFIQTEQFFRIKNEYKEHILFFQHSLTSNGIINEFQLILCRNVLMYFNNFLQEKVLKTFYDSMGISSFLALGKSEGVLTNGGQAYFNTYDFKNKIYRKK
jgi:chemotaxis protein methyltransferase CheR